MNIRHDDIFARTALPIHACLCNIGRCEPHRHLSAIEFVYCLEGELNLVAGHQRARLRAGDILSIDMDDTHCLWSDTPNVVLSLHVDMKVVRQEWEHTRYIYFAYDSHDLLPYHREAFERVRFLLLTAARRLFMGMPDGSDRAVDDIANAIVDILVEYFDWFNFHETYVEISDELRERYHRIATYCQQNYASKITMRHIAEQVHMSENYLSHYLRRGVFKKFGDMLNYIRCFESEKLLLNTRLPVSEISYRCGFSDPKYYYKHFKLWWDTTPLKHRKWYEDYISHEERLSVLPAQDALQFVEREIIDTCTELTLAAAAGRRARRTAR
jgi:AraC-like DNA-binding protein